MIATKQQKNVWAFALVILETVGKDVMDANIINADAM